jgi:hypothetical protein
MVVDDQEPERHLEPLGDDQGVRGDQIARIGEVSTNIALFSQNDRQYFAGAQHGRESGVQ